MDIQKVNDALKKFELDYSGVPRMLSKEETVVRISCIYEELFELIASTFKGHFDPNLDRNIVSSFLETLELEQTNEFILENQLDALVDIAINVIGMALRQGFDLEEAFNRVADANMQKQRCKPDGSDSKRGSGFDIMKPDGWLEPILNDLVSRKRLIVLDGSDCSGKTTLANHLADFYGAFVIHRTYTPELDKRMPEYLGEAISFYETTGGIVVIDRLILSEYVYSSVYRDGMLWDNERVKLLDRLEKLGAMHVICLPSDSEQHTKAFEESVKAGNEMYSSLDAVPQCYSDIFNKQPNELLRGRTKNILDTIDFISYDYIKQGKGRELELFCEKLLK